MKTNEIVLGLALTALCAASARAADVTTDYPSTTAHVSYARQSDGVLRVGVLLHNDATSETKGEMIPIGETYLVDPAAKQKHFVMKDESGHFLGGPANSDLQGGLFWVKLPPKSDTLVWFLFDALPSGHKVDLRIPHVAAIDGVEIVDAPPPGGDAASTFAPLVASVVSAKRNETQLQVNVKLHNPGTKNASFAGGGISFKDVYAIDPIAKKKYRMLTDAKGHFLARPMSTTGSGGSAFVRCAAGGDQTLELNFPAPADSVKSLDIVLPYFAPLEAVKLEGQGAAVDPGASVAGKSENLDATLKDLGAEKTADGIKVALSADLLFDFDKSDLKKEADPKLAELGKVLAAYPDAAVTIDGFTDSIGNDAYNLTLSEKRARTVATWLEKNAAVKPNRLRTKGYGKTRPVAPNTKPDGSDDPDGRAKNRRVEIFVKTKSA